jgi:2-methoxy-6-polyprenyl-1,4-benzoquinol methylase
MYKLTNIQNLRTKALSNNLFHKKPFLISHKFAKINLSFFSSKSGDNASSNNSYDTEIKDYTSFGFKTVKKEDRQNLVNSVFANVAAKYDIMNDAMSLGVHRIWKNEFVNSIGMLKPNRIYDSHGNFKDEKLKIIDVAGGTGDISFRIWEKAKNYSKNYFTMMPCEIKVVDINSNMLEVGRQRAEEMKITQEDIQWVECNAETLSFLPDNSIDLYTIAFGIRNCTNLDKVVKEAYRVLKKGGRFMCLEFSHVQVPILSSIYDFYSFNIIPQMGGIIANDKESYQYLVESIRNFPNQETFKDVIKSAGFEAVNYVNLSGGICAIHSGIKLN